MPSAGKKILPRLRIYWFTFVMRYKSSRYRNKDIVILVAGKFKIIVAGVRRMESINYNKAKGIFMDGCKCE